MGEVLMASDPENDEPLTALREDLSEGPLTVDEHVVPGTVDIVKVLALGLRPSQTAGLLARQTSPPKKGAVVSEITPLVIVVVHLGRSPKLLSSAHDLKGDFGAKLFQVV